MISNYNCLLSILRDEGNINLKNTVFKVTKLVLVVINSNPFMIIRGKIDLVTTMMVNMDMNKNASYVVQYLLSTKHILLKKWKFI